MTKTLDDWLNYQLRIHPKSVDMSLSRMQEVAKRLHITKPAPCVITVGGTNGKGSTVAYLQSIALAAGLRVGTYTSPHLLRYNERIVINGREVFDSPLCVAFERIEQARAEITLTYFEFATLAALLIFSDEPLDLVILEVGLGGRLDATNIIDADVAVITTVDLDHQDYLGPDRESIGAEKAGIMRTNKPVVLGEKDPPSSVLRRAYELGAIAIRGHSDYLIDREHDHWLWREPGYHIELPYPNLMASAQLDNAAAAIAALRASNLAISDQAIQQGISQTRLRGRLEKISDQPEIIVDVGHNPQAALQIAAYLRANPKKTYAVFAALNDKDVEALVNALQSEISSWWLAGIHDAGARNQGAEALASRVQPQLRGAPLRIRKTVAEALVAARQQANKDERILVFGSFHTVAEAIKAVETSSKPL
jgi:dihydrofolate synthase / folylpolyglutamate synthase